MNMFEIYYTRKSNASKPRFLQDAFFQIVAQHLLNVVGYTACARLAKKMAQKKNEGEKFWVKKIMWVKKNGVTKKMGRKKFGVK